MQKRAAALVAAFTLCFLALFFRTFQINNRMYADAARSGRTKTLEVGQSRGKIYDRNLDLLVDSTQRLVAAIVPSAQSYPLLENMLGAQAAQSKISSGKPLLLNVCEEIENSSAKSFRVPVRYASRDCAVHLVGYLDQSGSNGLSGIEKGYNQYLSENAGSLSVSFEVDANGRALAGLDKTITDNNFNSKAGVVLTVDSRIQKITEKALKQSEIKSGCALVMHVDTGEIYAMASVPDFDRNSISDYLTAENAPFVNKSLQSYSVGSVFKPLVAAAALENGISPDFEYTCTGSIKVGNRVFKCFSSAAHGKEDMTKALENSCNTYFVNLLEQSDPELLLSLCRSLGFSSEIVLADGIRAAQGILPDNNALLFSGNRANFAFGQGELLLTPIHLLAAYHALATGKSIKPTVFKGYANESGLVTGEPHATAVRVFSDSTVLKMREMLASVVENGNAKKAASVLASLAGKTGTAQSGIFKNKVEICRTWFCGFFPAFNPHYIVVILNEDGTSGSADCAPVFKKICEEIIHSE